MTLEEALLSALKEHPDGLSRRALQKAASRPKEAPWKLRRVLAALSQKGLVHSNGPARSRRYFPGPATGPLTSSEHPLIGTPANPSTAWAFSPQSTKVVALVRRAIHQRTPCSYERSFLDAYRPNDTFYLREQDRRRLRQLGTTPDAGQPAGTWARHILERLLIDLSWNSSRLEGNTYSLLDTERLFRDRDAAQGHQVLETQMLLNHKQAIEFLVDEASTLRLEPRTVRTLHGLLAENLLADPADEGRLRKTTVRIHDSTFLPLDVPQLIEEIFTQVLVTAAAIADPFEQSFFLLVHVPYLQPFADVNKRTSRLAANLPLLQKNLQPLSFVDVPREAYTVATLGVYEQRRVEALREVYLWAYQRSAERYRAVVKSLGEPDAFRLRYRDSLREVVRTVVLERVREAEVEVRVATLSEAHAPAADRSRFQAVALQELKHLNEGTIHRYRLRPSDLEHWVLR